MGKIQETLSKLFKKKTIQDVKGEETKKPSYSELMAKFNTLLQQYKDAEDTCAHEGYSYDDMRYKTQDLIKMMKDIELDMRLIMEPTIDYHVPEEISEKRITLEEFIKRSRERLIDDNTGHGYYASKNGVSDVIVRPSDVLSEKLRTDFTHVIWIDAK